MTLPTNANLHMLLGTVKVKARVQHPQVKARTDREGCPWVFRYWADEVQPDGSLRPVRKYHALGPSKGEGAISKKEAEVGRDRFLAKLNTPNESVALAQAAVSGAALLGEVAQLYIDGYLGREQQMSRPTRAKELLFLNKYIIPRWGKYRLREIQPKAVEDWLHTTLKEYWTMHAARAIMLRLYTYAEGHGLWEEGKRSPVSRAKLGKKRYVYERKILSFEETAAVLAQLEDPHRLIIEVCIATGARISEILGLQWKHVDLCAATIRIEQRVWHQEIGHPKTEGSRRVLGVGDAAIRLRERAVQRKAKPEDWVFSQPRDASQPMWDSAVRDALHQAAKIVGCDFKGFGPHSFRRAKVTWTQQVGGSAIEACKIAGHTDLKMTEHYTLVSPERQNELTRLIQQRIAEAVERQPAETPSTESPAQPTLSTLQPTTSTVQ